MRPTLRAALVVVLSTLLSTCGTPVTSPDAGVSPDVDGGAGADGGVTSDGGFDLDGGTGRECEACTGDGQCHPLASCAQTASGRACVPRCPPALTCPAGFTCAAAGSACLPTTRCCLDEDGDGHGRGVGCLGPDCDDARASANPAAPETCNGLDDDCDGRADEDLGQVSCGVGACAVTVERCVNGTPQVCTPGPTRAEQCNGVDDDCNGVTDDGLAPLTCGVGVCLRTVPVCVAGAPQQCLPGDAGVEACNALDDDCDGVVDDGDPDGGFPCPTGLTGPCGAGLTRCADGGVLACAQVVFPTTELCDGLDNDCNQATADGANDPQAGATCDGPDSDLCAEGTRRCASGALQCSDATSDTLDLCNGTDDDCDPASADGAEDPQRGSACDGTDTDLCPDGTLVCGSGALTCNDDASSRAEVCDGLDNDCNPATPDGSQDPLLGTGCDGPDSDLCVEGTRSCVAGALVCSDATGSTTDVCDGADNDCNPATADGAADPLVGTACDGADSDLCAEGTRACTAGALVCTDTTTSTLDVCNGLDDDCDAASADGAEDPQNGLACDGADSDLCAEGTRSCAFGSLFCGDVTGSSVDVCDGVDNDCDPASTDGAEDPQNGVACDGADPDLCAEGTLSCVAGGLACSDDASTAPDVCDGLDNDCNVATVDGAGDPLNGTACDGPDADLCNEGTRSCVAGALVCSDTTGGTPDVCDGADNDCNPATPDGANDPQTGVPCDGTDADLCADGARVCVSGAMTCNDTPASIPDLCDGVDNDCNPATVDGSSDPLNGTACDGADADLCNEGLRSCVAGAFTCSDPNDVDLDLCNGADDDCDPASADGSEDPLNGTACDGADSDLCVEGTRSCSAGALVCSDTTGSTVDLCNGVDDDCDPASADGTEDPQFGAACDGIDSDLCAEGARVCTAGVLVCNDPNDVDLDVCNGLNDDCDAASADGSEDPQNGAVCDGPDSDLCGEGTRSCSAGALVCSDTTGSTIDLCNGSDDDCDPASADGAEDPVNGTTCDGTDSDLCLEGTRSCSAGAIVCSDTTGSTIDVCNGSDDDCDPASADGSEDPQNGAVCDGPDSDLCGEGTRSCSAGALVCSDTTGSTIDLCNGIDDDCDAASADGSEDPSNGAICDGIDSDLCAEGTRSCSGGALVCNDPNDVDLDVCNGLNDDCDAASADGSEDPLNGTACDGPDTDLCNEGTRSCSAGALVCSDATGNNIEVCDNVDNDCNGPVDDGANAACPFCQKCQTGACVAQALGEDLKNECAPLTCTSITRGWTSPTCFRFAGAGVNNGTCGGAGACATFAQSCTGSVALASCGSTGCANIGTACVPGSATTTSDTVAEVCFQDGAPHSCTGGLVCRAGGVCAP